MKINHVFAILLTTVIAILVSACGGGGGGGGAGSSNTQQGYFIDSAVSGLAYSSASHSGTTDANGGFDYEPGETVTFSIGGITIGSAVAASTLTPISLVPGAVDESHPTVVNITRFLLTLDDDGNPDNGILISAATSVAAAAMSIDFEKSVTDFEMASDLVTAISVLTSSTMLISSADAQSHLRSTILTTYAGNYSGTYSGDDSGTWQVSVSSDGTLTGSGNDDLGGNFTITGAFTSSGEATLTEGGTNSGATYSGTVNFNGALSGTWQGVNSTTGTFSGSKQ